MYGGPDTFTVRLESGNGMEPEFRAGDFVYVDPDEPAEHGCCVAVRCGQGATTVRWLVIEDGRRVLWAPDPDVPDCVLDAGDETAIQGVVVLMGNAV